MANIRQLAKFRNFWLIIDDLMQPKSPHFYKI